MARQYAVASVATKYGPGKFVAGHYIIATLGLSKTGRAEFFFQKPFQDLVYPKVASDKLIFCSIPRDKAWSLTFFTRPSFAAPLQPSKTGCAKKILEGFF